MSRVCLTSGVFRWLCDIQAVRPEHGEGCSAGGVVLTSEGAQAILGGMICFTVVLLARFFTRAFARS